MKLMIRVSNRDHSDRNERTYTVPEIMLSIIEF